MQCYSWWLEWLRIVVGACREIMGYESPKLGKAQFTLFNDEMTVAALTIANHCLFSGYKRRPFHPG